VRDVPAAIRFWCAALDYQPVRPSTVDCATLVPRGGQGSQVERLLALGGRRVDWRYPAGADYVVLADPDGNTCCVVQKQRGSKPCAHSPVARIAP
jgi:hypothetical protein